MDILNKDVDDLIKIADILLVNICGLSVMIYIPQLLSVVPYNHFNRTVYILSHATWWQVVHADIELIFYQEHCKACV